MAPLLEQIEEDQPHAFIMGDKDNKIDKTFYGRIKLNDDEDEGIIAEEEQLQRQLDIDMNPVMMVHEVEKFDLHEHGMKDSTATQIDFPDVRIELGEIGQIEESEKEIEDKRKTAQRINQSSAFEKSVLQTSTDVFKMVDIEE